MGMTLMDVCSEVDIATGEALVKECEVFGGDGLVMDVTLPTWNFSAAPDP